MVVKQLNKQGQIIQITKPSQSIAGKVAHSGVAVGKVGAHKWQGFPYLIVT